MPEFHAMEPEHQQWNVNMAGEICLKTRRTRPQALSSNGCDRRLAIPSRMQAKAEQKKAAKQRVKALR